MAKYLVVPVTQTEDMYGYSAIIVALTESNLDKVNHLKSVLEQVRKIDPNVSEIIYNLTDLDVDLLTDEFDCDSERVTVEEISNSELEEFKNATGNSYKVDSPSLKVGDMGITLIYFSKHTSDEAYGTFDVEQFLKEFEL